jgi:uncharacterized metal-binding protein YceD (DUF177 family)
VLEPAGASPRGPGTLKVELTKHGPDVMVRGHAQFSAVLPCVVTLDPVTFDLGPEIFLMLKPGPPAQHSSKGKLSPAGGKSKVDGAAPPANPRKPGRRPKGQGEDRHAELPAEDGAPDTYSGEEIVLDEFVREFLLLELPLYPRRPDLPSAEESIDSRPLAGPTGEKSIDPRLEPLKKLAARLRGAANKE